MDNKHLDEYYIDYEACEKVAPKRVIAKFKKEILKSKTAPSGDLKIIPVLDNLTGSYNIPRSIRTANVFGAEAVYIAGTKFFNPYPAVGSVRHTKINFFDTMTELINKLEHKDYSVYVFLPPKYGGQSIWDTKFNLDGSAVIVGNEVKGISFDINKYPNITPVFIPHRGITESLNVSVAISIALAEFDRQKRLKKTS